MRSKRNTKTTMAKNGTSRTQANGAGKPKPAIRKPFFDRQLVAKAAAEVIDRTPGDIHEFTPSELQKIFNTPTLQEAIKWSGNPGDKDKRGGESYGNQMFKAFKKRVDGMLPTIGTGNLLQSLTKSWNFEMGSHKDCFRRKNSSCVHAQNNKANTASQIVDLAAMNSKLTAKLKRSAECEQETIGNLKAEHHAEVATLKAEIATLKAKQAEITMAAGASARSLAFNDPFTRDFLASDTQSANPCLVDPQMTIADGPGQLLPWQLQMHP